LPSHAKEPIAINYFPTEEPDAREVDQPIKEADRAAFASDWQSSSEAKVSA
jgi:hypothetical protein